MTNQLKQLRNLAKKLCILYVEDDTDLLKSTQAMFHNIFQEVETATNGEEGLKKYNEYFLKHGKYFDIVVTDIKMPKMDGVCFSKEIKRKNSRQLIVVTSAYDDSHNLIEFINLEIKRFIKKPFTLEGIITSFLDIVIDLQTDKNVIKIAQGYSWNINEKKLYKDNKEIKLTYNENIILDLFFNNRYQIFSNNDLYYILERDNFNKEISIDSIKAILKRLRKKLPSNFIENIYAQGYRIDKSLIISW